MNRQTRLVRNEKGLTLLEILAAVVLLSIAIMLFTNLFANAFERSAKEQKQDEFVVIARTVMEEMKVHLPQSTSTSITLFGQTVGIGNFRTTAPPVPAITLSYPDASTPTYTVTIRTEPVTDYNVAVSGHNFDIRNYFRRVIVEVRHPGLDKSYTLESLIEYNQFSL